MNTIDLDAIFNDKNTLGSAAVPKHLISPIREAMIEACKQTLVLASENARTKAMESYHHHEYHYDQVVDKQSILDVEKLIK